MRASSISVSSLPQALQDELSSPFSKDSAIENEYSELAKVVVQLIPNFFDEEIIEIYDETPIFRRNESSTRKPAFITSTQIDIHLNSEPENDIFVALDYSNLSSDFRDIDDAINHLNEWADYVNNSLTKLTPFAPKIKVHIFESTNLQSYDVLDIYNNLYHPNETSYKAGYAKRLTPRVIIDCGEHINFPTGGDENQIGCPHFRILYSIVNSRTQSKKEGDITNFVSKLGNGFAILHDTEPSMDVVANILELSTIIAARFTYRDESSNLIQSMLKGSIASSSAIMGSKSSAVSSRGEYREIPLISVMALERISSKWEKCGKKSSFYDNLVNFDNNISDFNYRCNTGLRHDLENFNSNLIDYCRNLMLKLINGKNDSILDLIEKYLNLNPKDYEQVQEREEIKTAVKSLLEKEEIGLQFHEWVDLVKKSNDYNERSRWRSVIMKNQKVLLHDSFIAQKPFMPVDELLGMNFTEVARRDVYVLVKELVNLNEKQSKSYYSISKLHHSKSNNVLLRKLHGYGVNLNLIDHFAIHRNMREYLAAISSLINSLKENSKQHLSEMVSDFYGIRPVCENRGEEE